MNTDLAKLQHFALSDAWLCLDCQHVSDGRGVCPACGSASMLMLVKVLDRLTKEEYAEQR